MAGRPVLHLRVLLCSENETMPARGSGMPRFFGRLSGPSRVNIQPVQRSPLSTLQGCYAAYVPVDWTQSRPHEQGRRVVNHHRGQVLDPRPNDSGADSLEGESTLRAKRSATPFPQHRSQRHLSRANPGVPYSSMESDPE